MKKVVGDSFRIDFIGIGAGKSGTTWLADKLRLHPQIFIPAIKEIRYFNRLDNLYQTQINVRYGKSLEWYHSFFKKARTEQICGEISPAYLRNENCARDIFKYNPAVKILIVLRDPVQRSFSNYLSGRQWGTLHDSTFIAAVEKYPNILKNSLYFDQLNRYFKIFPKENIKVLFYSDLMEDCYGFYKEALLFLNVREYYPDDLESKANESKAVRLKFLANWISKTNFYIYNYPKLRFLKQALKTAGLSAMLARINEKPFKEKPQLDKGAEIKLRMYFREDIEKLEDLLNKDLSHWK